MIQTIQHSGAEHISGPGGVDDVLAGKGGIGAGWHFGGAGDEAVGSIAEDGEAAVFGDPGFDPLDVFLSVIAIAGPVGTALPEGVGGDGLLVSDEVHEVGAHPGVDGGLGGFAGRLVHVGFGGEPCPRFERKLRKIEFGMHAGEAASEHGAFAIGGDVDVADGGGGGAIFGLVSHDGEEGLSQSVVIEEFLQEICVGSDAKAVAREADVSSPLYEGVRGVGGFSAEEDSFVFNLGVTTEGGQSRDSTQTIQANRAEDKNQCS